MTLDISQMTAKLRKVTGIDVNDLSDTDVLLNFNISWWEIMDIFEFREKERRTIWQTVAGQVFYPVVQPFDALQGLSIRDDSGQYTPLIKIDPSEYEIAYQDTDDARGNPTRYFRENENVGLWPTPDDVYTITERDLVTLSDLAVLAPPIPQSWHEVIFLGGVYRSFWDIGDKTSAAYYEKVQANKANTRVPVKAKEEKADNKYAGLRMLSRPFRSGARKGGGGGSSTFVGNEFDDEFSSEFD